MEIIPFEKELVRAGDYTVSSGYKAILEMESAGLDYSACYFFVLMI